MPSSKLIYMTSDANLKEHPKNTNTNFKFIVRNPIQLVTPNRLLAIAVKGIFIPGKNKGANNPEYIKIHLDIVNHQNSDGKLDQCVAMLNYVNNVEYIESKKVSFIPLHNDSISELNVRITDEKDELLDIENNDCPTVVKIEVTTMSQSAPSFTVTCNASLKDQLNNGNQFSITKIPNRIDFENIPYRVGLTTAIIPNDGFRLGAHEPFIVVYAGVAGSDNNVIRVRMTVNMKKVINIFRLLLAINQTFAGLSMGFYASYPRRTKQIKFEAKPTKYIKEKMAEVGVQSSLLEGILDVKNEVLFKKEPFTNWENKMPSEETIKSMGNDIKLSWFNVSISDNLMNILVGRLENYNFTIDYFDNRSHTILNPDLINMDLERNNVYALAIHSPLVTETVFGNIQDHLIQIIPSNNNGPKTLVYNPEEITYHDVAKVHINEVPIKITNLTRTPIHQLSDKPITLVLHFKAK